MSDRLEPTENRFPDPDGDVSVVIVAYQCEDILDECLASFERHKPERVGEVLVIDNTVPTPQSTVAKRYDWVGYDPVGENLHFRKAVNRGAQRARLPYLFVLNPDTRLDDAQSIAKLAEVLDDDKTVGFVGPKMASSDGVPAPQGERLAGLLYLFALKSYLNTIWRSNPIARWASRAGVSREHSGPVATVSAGAMLCRRNEFLAVGGFDERATIYWEEHELARKLKKCGLHGYYRADAFVFHYWRKGGTEHDSMNDSKGYFNDAMALYYRTQCGVAGHVLFAMLDRWQRLARKVTR